MAAVKTERRIKGTSLFRRLAYISVIGVCAMSAAPMGRAATPDTPLEASDFKTLPTNEDVIAYLRNLAAAAPNMKVEIVGRSSGDLPIAAVTLSDAPNGSAPRAASAEKLTVLLIGSQHGTEPSGAEALQRLVRDVATGPMTDLLKTINLVIVPVANPDGRNLRRRTNAKGVNLSTDFLVQTQPETRALTALIRRVRPDVILDVHESGVYKPSTLGAQGYLTDVEAQFEYSNNPNVATPIRQIARTLILPEVIAATAAGGLRAAHYVGEITDIHQPISHGGLSLRNLRNYGAMLGALSMLVENRLDQPGDYPTPRNIRVRVEKQYLSVKSFLAVVEKHRAEIRKALKQSAHPTPSPSGPVSVALAVQYEADSRTPTITLPMSRIRKSEGEKGNGSDIVIDSAVQVKFAYHPRIVTTVSIPLPRAYAITAHQQAIAALFEHHGIAFETLTRRRTARGEVRHVDAVKRRAIPHVQVGPVLEFKTTLTIRDIALDRGDLWVDLRQPLGLLVPLMIDPRSTSSIYRDPAFASLVEAGQDLDAVAIR
jgi:Zinc carboxypeptidase